MPLYPVNDLVVIDAPYTEVNHVASVVAAVTAAANASDGLVDSTRFVPSFKLNSVRNAAFPGMSWAATASCTTFVLTLDDVWLQRLASLVNQAAERWEFPTLHSVPK